MTPPSEAFGIFRPFPLLRLHKYINYLYTMKKLTLKSYIGIVAYVISAIIILFGGSSCNLTKKINHAKTTEEKINNLITAFSATTTERIDTTVSINTASVSGTKTLSDMLRGDSIFEDTPELTITTRIYNGRIFTKAIRKPVFVPVKLDRTVTSNSMSVYKGSVKTSSVSVVKNVERKPSWFNWLWLLLLLIPLAIWKYRAKIWKWILG